MRLKSNARKKFHRKKFLTNHIVVFDEDFNADIGAKMSKC